MIEIDTHLQALKINPAYKKEQDDHRKSLEIKVAAPVVETPNPILKQNDEKLAEARKAFYEASENYNMIAGGD